MELISKAHAPILRIGLALVALLGIGVTVAAYPLAIARRDALVNAVLSTRERQDRAKVDLLRRAGRSAALSRARAEMLTGGAIATVAIATLLAGRRE